MDVQNFSKLCKLPNVEMMRIYYEDYKSNIDLNYVNEGKTTYLMISASNGLFENVKYLLRWGADPNVTNSMNYTALLCAVYMRGLTKKEEYLDIVRFLMRYGANKDHQNNLGESAMELAIKANDAEMVDVLLQIGCSLDKVNPFNLLSPHDFALKINNPSVIQTIINYRGNRPIQGDPKDVIRNLLSNMNNSR
jgi:ankyrin repeat protein